MDKLHCGTFFIYNIRKDIYNSNKLYRITLKSFSPESFFFEHILYDSIRYLEALKLHKHVICVYTNSN